MAYMTEVYPPCSEGQTSTIKVSAGPGAPGGSRADRPPLFPLLALAAFLDPRLVAGWLSAPSSQRLLLCVCSLPPPLS